MGQTKEEITWIFQPHDLLEGFKSKWDTLSTTSELYHLPHVLHILDKCHNFAIEKIIHKPVC